MVLLLDEPQEFAGPRDIGPFSDIDEVQLRREREGLQSAQVEPRLMTGYGARRHGGDGLGNRPNVRRRCSAAAAHNVHQAFLGKILQQPCHVLGRLVVFTKLVGQTGIGVRAGECLRDTGNLLDMRTQVFGSQCTVKPDTDRVCMHDRVPECLRRLPCQGATTGIRDRSGYHNRQVLSQGLQAVQHRINCRLGIEGIKNGFYQENIRSALNQAPCGFGIGLHQFVKRNIPETRIIDIRRNRGGTVAGAQNTRDKTGPAGRLFLDPVGHGSGQAGSFHVQFMHQVLHVVIRHGNRIGIEGVGLENVGARFKILPMNVGNDVGLSEGQ